MMTQMQPSAAPRRWRTVEGPESCRHVQIVDGRFLAAGRCLIRAEQSDLEREFALVPGLLAIVESGGGSDDMVAQVLEVLAAKGVTVSSERGTVRIVRDATTTRYPYRDSGRALKAARVCAALTRPALAVLAGIEADVLIALEENEERACGHPLFERASSELAKLGIRPVFGRNGYGVACRPDASARHPGNAETLER